MDLYYKWESLVMSSSFASGRMINEDTVQSLKGLLQADLNKTKAASQSRVKPEFSGKMMRGRISASMLGLESRMNSRTSGVGLVKPTITNPFSSTPSSSSTPAARAGPSKVTFSTDIDEESKKKRGCEYFMTACEILELTVDLCTDRYMYEKIMERSEGALKPALSLHWMLNKSRFGPSALDDRIDDFAEMIRDHYNLTGLGDPTSSTDVSNFLL